jgi:hypothetical protein
MLRNFEPNKVVLKGKLSETNRGYKKETGVGNYAPVDLYEAKLTQGTFQL